jgi:carbon storage regulator CsrA
MLIMWRRCGESLFVGEAVEIEVLDARANRVKLGIVAPETVQITRKEARITREENLAAALSADQQMIENLLRCLPSRNSRSDD